MVDMDVAIWGELPFDIVERVLSFLLLPDVCRYRMVSTKWNELIQSQKFATLHGQHARQCARPSFIAMQLRYQGDDRDGEVWCCLDLDARRWYTFHEANCNDGPFVSGIRSMDGGLVCRFGFGSLHPQPIPPRHTLVVQNVNGDRQVLLPEIARHVESPEALLVVEGTAYKIFVRNPNFVAGVDALGDPLPPRGERLRLQVDPFLHVYDSATSEWTTIQNPPGIARCAVGYIYSIVFYHGFLYALFLEDDPEGDGAVMRLQRCSLTAESWEIVDVCINRVIVPSLAVSGDYLLLVGWCREASVDSNEEFFLVVCEIRTRDMMLETVLKLSSADVMASFDISLGPRQTIKMRSNLLGIRVIGCENSLFLTSDSSGKAKLFHLKTRSWDDDVPPNPLVQGEYDTERSTWIGNHMNLLLPWNNDW